MGISVRTGSPLALDIAPPMWKLLVGLPLSVDDLIEIDKDYMAGKRLKDRAGRLRYYD